MWNDLSVQWQTAFSEAWEAFRAGSVPIGAALYSAEGELILKDHNRSREPVTVNRSISHAEANLLRRLDTKLYEPRSLVLYSAMEPCPMCMGTCVMSNIRDIRYAARDPYCGMVYLAERDPYCASKSIHCSHEGGEAEHVQITVQSYYELRYCSMGHSSKVLDRFREMLPEAVWAAERLFSSRELDRLAEQGTLFGEVFDLVLSIKL